MSLYQLTESKVFTELQTDTRCLLAWNATRIVITFRGTASVKNAKADLQVCQTGWSLLVSASQLPESTSVVCSSHDCIGKHLVCRHT